MSASKTEFNQRILLAIDDSENSLRAVNYIGQMLGGLEGFEITLLHVIPEPEEDYFRDRSEQESWLAQYREKMNGIMESCRLRLLESGFSAEDLSVRIKLKSCPSLAECILAERKSLGCDTIVVGRQGLSRSEEFLFGSVSSKIVTHSRNCTVWVVE
jgi:nucleotide-binding universal stress UspA family protein